MKNALLLILLLLILDANVAAAAAAAGGASSRIHLRGRRAKSNKHNEPQHRNAVEEDSTCQCLDNDIDLIGTKWNLTNFTWHGDPEEVEESLHPVNLTQERRGMTLLLESYGSSGTCGNNICWGVSEEIPGNDISSSTISNSTYKMYWIHDLARTRMRSTPQEEAYVEMLTRGPYIYNTCVNNCTNRTKLQFFEVDIDDDDNLVPGRRMAIYDQMQLLF
mmetsp:Transcript_25582/g.36500  ORF Transcript_25582/g.36500 Transcript_25582/m.36500 type:complete len:219 (+) Transcript_25582:92-748(+)